jgi:hypothetical protein
MGSQSMNARTAYADACPDEASLASKRGLILGLAQRQDDMRIGGEAAIHWRESRRCPECRALAFEGCVHRPNGLHEGVEIRRATVGHMPFRGHRTQAEVRLQESFGSDQQ